MINPILHSESLGSRPRLAGHGHAQLIFPAMPSESIMLAIAFADTHMLVLEL